MRGTSWVALFGASFLFGLPEVRAETEAGVIAAATVAGLVLLGGIIGVSIFCFKRHGGCDVEDEKPKKTRRHKKHHHRANGVPPPPYAPQYHVNNGYVHKSNGFVRPAPIAPIPPPQVRPGMYPTYHGPPPEFVGAQRTKAGTLSGPPTIVIPFDRGTVTMRPDPRPVIKTRQYKPKEAPRDERRHQHRSKSHERSRDPQKQEFMIQQSYDGIPVIRPVIYVDDDRQRHRSKSKTRSKSRERPEQTAANVITIPYETQTAEIHSSDREERTVTENNVSKRPKAPTPPPPVRSPERSRASSVTGALNALRRSTKDHAGHDSDSDSSNAPSFNWAANTDRAPDPRAGDVMFYPAGTDQTADTNKPENKDQIYGYTTVIKQSMRDTKNASVVIQEPERPSTSDQPDARFEGYEVPRQSRNIGRGSVYETELSQTRRDYNSGIGASMSDRLQYLVEDGDKTRFTRYNVGAVNFEEEKTEDDEPVQMRVRRRPDTPPADFQRDSGYSQVPPRPKTPPRDIPLITPRESTEIPPLDLQSSVNSPISDFRRSLRPVTPPHDFLASPTRPKSPPTDFHSPRPPTPPRDIDTNRSAVGNTNLDYSFRSQPVDPNTGDPGSFQARQRFIEAQLKKNTPDKPTTEQSSRKPEVVSRAMRSSPIEKPTVEPVHVPAGVVPPPPPPPPLPK